MPISISTSLLIREQGLMRVCTVTKAVFQITASYPMTSASVVCKVTAVLMNPEEGNFF